MFSAFLYSYDREDGTPTVITEVLERWKTKKKNKAKTKIPKDQKY